MTNKLQLAPIGNIHENFNRADSLAIKDDGVFRVFKSERSFDIMGQSGPIIAVVDDKDNVSQWVFPPLAKCDYQFIDRKTYDYWAKIVSLIEKHEKRDEPAGVLSQIVKLRQSPFDLAPTSSFMLDPEEVGNEN